MISASLGKRKRQPAIQHCDDEVESDDDCESTGVQGRARRVNQMPNGEEPVLTATQARAQARAEGLVLVPADSATGFKGVYRHGGMFEVQAPRNGGKQVSLGHFGTPEAAAVAAKAEAAKPELTAEQAKAQARAEGLVLARADSSTGFTGVCRECGRCKALGSRNGTRIHLGNFTTPKAAALAYARHVAAAPPDAPRPQLTEADESQAADTEAAALTAQPEGRNILFDLNSDDSSSEDDDDDGDPAATTEAANTAEAGTSTSAEADTSAGRCELGWPG
eukprot:1794890-Prymnesium_polylepis.1